MYVGDLHMSEVVYFLEQAADKIGIELKHLKDWLKDGLVAGTKVSSKWHIKESSLIDFLSENPTVFLAGYSKGFADGLGRAAKFYYPEGIAVDLAGNIYVADTKNHRIRKITQKGEVTTLAGTDEKGFVDGVGKEARFHTPTGIAVDKEGYIYVADSVNHSIRKISSNGEVITLAGSGKSGYADGLGNKARFASPYGLAIDKNGNIFVSEQKNNRIRKICPGGEVITIAGTGEIGFVDGEVKEAKFDAPKGLAIDSKGNIYVVDSNNHLIRKITSDGQVETIAGKVKECNWFFNKELSIAKETSLNTPTGIVIDENDNIYLTERKYIRKISTDGTAQIISDFSTLYREGLISNACFYEPTGIAIDTQGSIYIVDCGNSRIRKLLAPGIITKDKFIELQPTKIEIPSKTLAPELLKDLPLKDKLTKTLDKTPSSELLVSTLVKLKLPNNKEARSLLTDGTRLYLVVIPGELYQITGDGELKFIVNIRRDYWQRENIVLNSEGILYQAIETKIYKRDIKNIAPSKNDPYSNDYGELIATFPSRIKCITVDYLGNIYSFLDTRELYKFTTDKEMVTLLTSKMLEIDGSSTESLFRNVKSLLADKKGNLYFACESRVFKLDSNRTLSTFVGKDYGYKDAIGQDAKLKSPYSLVYGHDDVIYFNDIDAHVVRKITLAGEVSWVAGRRTKGFTDGSLKDAQFNMPFSLVIDKQGIFYIADLKNKAIRVIKREDQKLTLDETLLSSEKTSSPISSLESISTIPLPPKEKFIIPNAEEMFWVYEERGSSCGLVDKTDVMNRIAQDASIDDVLEILENSQNLGQVITCLFLMNSILFRNPSFSDQAERLLLKLMSDSRKYFARVDNFNNHFIATVGQLANLRYCEIIKKKKVIEQQIEAFIDGIKSLIKLESDDSYIMNSLLYAFYDLWKGFDAKTREETTKQVGDIFCGIITDSSYSSAERVKAYESITFEISTNRETKGVFEQIRQKAAAILINIYTDNKEDEKLRSYVKNNLNAIAPDAIEKLQQKGFIPSKEVPEIKDLFAYSSVDSSKVTSCASEVSAYEVLEILQSNRSVTVDKLLAAIYLAPIVARRYNWQAFAHTLINLIYVYKEHKFKVNNYDVMLEVSRVSSENLEILLKERPISDKDVVLDYAWRLINLTFDKGFGYGHSPNFLVWGVKNLISNLSSKEVLDKTLQEIFLSPWRSPAARYLAYKEGDWSDKVLRQKGWESLLNPNENSDLRALLGASMHGYLKDAVEGLVDKNQKPWQLLPKSPKDLPISAPPELVPESWLMTTLVIAKDYEIQRQTLNNLASRIGIDEKYTREEIMASREKVVAYVKSHPNLKNILKQMCKKRVSGNIAIIAAKMLALLGDPEEETTMVDLLASGLSGWTTLKPLSNDWNGMNLLMTVLASNKVTDNVYSTFEPYIIVGYGDEKARLINSRVFVLLAESYEKEGDREKAIRAYKWAIKRDGFNLSARQGLKKLEEGS